MKTTWLQRKIIHQWWGTERGDKIIAFIESEAGAAAYQLLKSNLLPAIIALIKQDWRGFWTALPEEWRKEVKGVSFIVAPVGSRSVGLVNRLDGKGYVPASTPEERAAANEQIALASASRLIKDNLGVGKSDA